MLVLSSVQHMGKSLRTKHVIDFSAVWQVALVAVILIAAIYLWPLHEQSLIGISIEHLSYSQAVIDASAQKASDAKAGVEPDCLTQLDTHGTKTAQAVVMFHGVGSCPEQMGGLAAYFYSHGFNVYVARWPWHGLSNTRLHGRLTAQELVQTTNEAVNIGAGLGNEVGVVGFSGGGVMATWAAEYRPETISRLLVLSPFYEPSTTQTPGWERKPAEVLYGYGILPDTYTSTSMNGLSYHALAQFTRMTANLTTTQTNFHLKSVGVGISSTDTDIDHGLARSIPQTLAKTDNSSFQVWTSPTDWKLEHDIVSDEDDPYLTGHFAQIYPEYLKLYEGM